MSVLQGIVGAGALSIFSTIALVYRRFRHTGVGELESFSRYVGRGIKYYLGRYIYRQLAAELVLRQYARVHLKTTATDMPVPARYPLRLKVDEVFIPLLLRGGMGEILEYRDLVNKEGGRIVVIGDPGSGKSSLMKRTYRDACRRANGDPRRSQLPILFSLSDLRQLTDNDLAILTGDVLLTRLIDLASQTAVFDGREGVERLRHGAGYLVLLDGLDEVPSRSVSRVTQAIVQLAQHLSAASSRSTLVITTRTQHYVATDDSAFKSSFDVLSIRPFLPGDIYRFLSKWPFTKERRANVTRLVSRIRQLPSLAEMCTNPLALAMFAAQDQQTEAALSPETRSEFYASLVDELIVNRRLRAEDVTIGRRRLWSDRTQILGETCLGHLLDGDEAHNSVPLTRLHAAIGRIEPNASVEDYVNELAVDTGLYSQERWGATITFLHLSLCEFLAAREVLNRGSDAWAEITMRITGDGQFNGEAEEWRSRLGEVISFAAGLAPREFQIEIFATLLELEDHGLLLRATIEAQLYRDLRVIDAVRAEAERLGTVEAKDRDVAWFARLRQMIAVLRDAHQGTRELPLSASTRLPTPAEYLVGLIDSGGSAQQLLGALARDDAAAAVAIAEAADRPELRQVVATAADEVSVAVGILARSDAGNSEWQIALVIAALRQRQVAETLRSITEDGSTGSAPGWSTSFILKGTAYGRLLVECQATFAVLMRRFSFGLSVLRLRQWMYRRISRAWVAWSGWSVPASVKYLSARNCASMRLSQEA